MILNDFPGFPHGITLEKALKLQFGPVGRKSTERMSRVMDACKGGTSAFKCEEQDPVVALESNVSPLLFLSQTKCVPHPPTLPYPSTHLSPPCIM